MKKVIALLLLIAVAVFTYGTDVSPEQSGFHIFGDSTLTIIPNDTVYSSWMNGPGTMSEGTLAWFWSGDGSGSVASLIMELQMCWFSHKSYGYSPGIHPDTSYQTVWDTVYVPTDSNGFYWLANYGSDGWTNPPHIRWRFINLDTDTCTLYKAKVHMAGSE